LGIFIGPFVIGALFTLREKAMLGDTGANLAGAVIGIIFLTQLDPTGRLISLGAFLALTVYAEFFSISKTIDRLPPLRFIDSLGRVRGK
jgi:UDP-N-acetylmuramyl pentapeptide phosphotransferase/UDP-N-acetylglucosamine-1-phosphate transferase